jgi:hypothetical protein
MGKCYEQLDERLIDFIGRQHVFFVGTAPTASNGHLNISPKGLDTFRILGPTTVAYLDLTGSGIETVAHVRENGRITIMLCAFEGSPLILRLYGRGRVVEPGDPEWDELLAGFPPQPGARSVVILELNRIAESCGFAVPVYEYRRERTQLTNYARRKGRTGLERYRAEKNLKSLDGLDGLARIEGIG